MISDPYHAELFKTALGADERQFTMSVVAPCYNEVGNIDALTSRVADACTSILSTDWELILVNDGSRDDTWSSIVDKADASPHITAVNLSRNFGHQAALSAGLAAARGDYILIIDADLQDPPELMGAMLSKMRAGADVVYGQRRARPGDRSWRKLAAGGFYRLLNSLADVDLPLDTGDFRMISRRVRDVLLSLPENDRYVRGIVSWIGFRQEAIVYDRDERHVGETGYSISRLISLAVDGITGFSIRPLRLALWVGVLVAAASFIYTIYIVLKGTVGGVEVSGWSSLMAAILFLGGVQMIFLGLLGEYLGRTFLQTKNRPFFIIEQIRYGKPSDYQTPPKT